MSEPKEPSLGEMLGTLLGHARLCHGCKLRGQAHDLERLRATLAARLEEINPTDARCGMRLRALAAEIRGQG